jgi:RNA polymerase sigma factor (sigma-70 family)
MHTEDRHHSRTRPPRGRGTQTCIPMRTTDVRRLLRSATAGEEWAWTALIVRFRPTVMTIARRHRLTAADCDEVAQRTWLRLLRHIETIEQPSQLGSWLATTARNESLRLLGRYPRETLVADAPERAEDLDLTAAVSAAERYEALGRALERVTERERALVRLLMRDPTPSYRDISRTLGMPVGSIGPTRARCIARLRRDPHLIRAVGAGPGDRGTAR